MAAIAAWLARAEDRHDGFPEFQRVTTDFVSMHVLKASLPRGSTPQCSAGSGLDPRGRLEDRLGAARGPGHGRNPGDADDGSDAHNSEYGGNRRPGPRCM